jgi:hypothetical protein
MGVAFDGAESFNQDLNSWDVSSVNSFGYMFRRADLFNGDISAWNVSSGTQFAGMFNQAYVFNQDLGAWDVSSATSMNSMFSQARDFNYDISFWDVSNVKKMDYMFNHAFDFDQDITSWDVSLVQDMSFMFRGVDGVNYDFGNWNISSLTNASAMFSQTEIETAFYDSLLIGWQRQSHHDSLTFGAGTSVYCLGAQARDTLLSIEGWNISDGGGETEAPIAICKDVVAYLDQDGTVSVTAEMLNDNSSDNCGELTLEKGNVFYDCESSSVVDTLFVQDNVGNAAFCLSTVTILDSNNLVIFDCPSDTVIEAHEINCSATLSWEEPYTTCSTDSIWSNYQSGDQFDLGSNIVTYQAQDVGGDNAACMFTVFVYSDLNLIIDSLQNVSCENALDGRVYGQITGGNAPYTIDWDQDGFDYDDELESEMLQFGVNSLQIRDSTGCSMDTSITISMNPVTVVFCPSDTVYRANADDCKGELVFSEPLFSCEDVTLIQTYNLGDEVELGTYPIVYTAVDVLSNVASCVFLVEIYNDFEVNIDSSVAPTCLANADGVAYGATSGGTVPIEIDWSLDGVGDFDDQLVQSSLDTGYHYLLAQDAYGCSYQYTVLLTASSVGFVQCSTDTAYYADVMGCRGIVQYSLPELSCPDGDLTQSYTIGDTIDIGAYEVVFTVSDDLGNSETCSSFITVLDSTEAFIDSVSAPSCYGALDGYVTLIGSSSSFLINEGQDTLGLTGLSAGVYELWFEDSLGCEVNDTITLIERDSLEMSLLTYHNTGDFSAIIESDVTGGTEPYAYYWSHDTEEELFFTQVAIENWYVLNVADSMGCQVLDSVYVDEDLIYFPCTDLSFELYPVPAIDYIRLAANACLLDAVVDVYDALGRNLYHKDELGFDLEIDLTQYAIGTYVIQLTNEAGETANKKFLKQ